MSTFSKKVFLSTTISFLLILGGVFVYHVARATSAVAIVVDGVTYATIREAIEAAPPSERGTIKGREIAKLNLRGEYISQEHGVRIDIQDIKAIEGGVEILARAWRRGEPVGFGKDGSVEIERFIIYNPPILVDDPQGDIVREWRDVPTGALRERRLREDPAEAVRQVIAHNITLVGKEGTAIIPGKVGNTTSTFFPAAGQDAAMRHEAIGSSWSTLTGGAGTDVFNGTLTLFVSGHSSNVSSNLWNQISRSVITFPTAALPDTASIDSATLSLYGDNKYDEVGSEPSVQIYSSAPASETSVAVGDYDSLGSTAFSTAIGYSSWSTTAYNDFSLNTSGKANISKTAASSFGAADPTYDRAGSPPTWSSNKNTMLFAKSADNSGTSNDPKLVVVHSPTPPTLSSVAATNVTETSATITWTTNQSSDSEVTYDNASPVTESDPSIYDGTMTTSHSVSLTNLTPNTTYYYVASSTNADNSTGTSTELSFVTGSQGGGALTNIRATNVGSGWADIKWTSSSAGDSKVWYSLTSPISVANFTEAKVATSTTSHSVYIDGLLHNAVYYYIVVSTDGSGNAATSSQKSFNTTSTALCSD